MQKRLGGAQQSSTAPLQPIPLLRVGARAAWLCSDLVVTLAGALGALALQLQPPGLALGRGSRRSPPSRRRHRRRRAAGALARAAAHRQSGSAF